MNQVMAQENYFFELFGTNGMYYDMGYYSKHKKINGKMDALKKAVRGLKRYLLICKEESFRAYGQFDSQEFELLNK